MDKRDMMFSVMLSKSYTDKRISELPVAFKPEGSIDFDDLPQTIIQDDLGKIWNVNDSFTTDARFIEGAGTSVPAHSNVMVIEHDGSYYLDLFSMVDLSNYLAKDNESEFEPENDYNPATKKYVDDAFDQLEDDIPGDISELNNDSGYQTQDDVNNLIGSHHIVIHSESSTTINGKSVPALTTNQVITAYNALAAGDKAVIVNNTLNLYLEVIEASYIAEDELTVSVLYKDSLILTYNTDEEISYRVLEGQIVEYSREYGNNPNDGGYVREWSPNVQEKVWAECGLIETTLDTGLMTVTLPVTYESTNFYISVSARDQGNFHIFAQPISTNQVNVRATDVNGSPKAISVSIEARGWKDI